MARLIIGIILTVLALFLLLFTIQNYFGYQVELEPAAANMVLIVTGLPGFLLAAGGVVLIFSYSKRSRQSLPRHDIRVGNSQPGRTLYCRNCGGQLNTNSNYCPKCGTNALA
ncbi:hypothetical protein Dform_01687 [Dehalogenimonas formicexedens]|uniref:Zinc-ribbon domain-containing protein n=1 Tax=Dehalogenimonas formicexedens TaxID=1839801 RepID=A0A1P8F967_9CHLR|nr:hypothetical protein Dform_01687 [Dehalogenimonas formicexedens]